MSSENSAVGGRTLRVGIIGTGRPWKSEGSTGFGMASAHVGGYKSLPNCQVVALCDLERDRADEFNEKHLGGAAAVYTDYPTMLTHANLDMVSVCVWPDVHAPIVIDVAKAGVKVGRSATLPIKTTAVRPTPRIFGLERPPRSPFENFA